VGDAATPTWSADGRWIAYLTRTGLWKVEAGGSAAPVRIFEPMGNVPAAWSPDGKWITAVVEGKIGVVSPDGTQKRVCFNRPNQDFTASLGWSRDGSTLFLMEKIPDHSRLSAFDLARSTERVVRDYPPDTKNYADPVTPGSRLYPDLRSSSEKAVKDAFPRLATALA
jgi:Tol biopolymer transport system component